MMSTDMHAIYQSDTTFWAWDHFFFFHEVNKWRKFKDCITYVKGRTWLSKPCKEQQKMYDSNKPSKASALLGLTAL